MVDPARLEELRRQFEGNPRRYFAPLASALRRSGDAPGAVTLARTQLAVYPGHLTGHVILGQALLDVGDAGAARDAFARAAELDAGNVVALQQLLTLARDAGDALATRHWTDRLVEADPELAAEVTGATPGAEFEPLDLETLGAGGPGAFASATLDPRLAVDAARAPAPNVGREPANAGGPDHASPAVADPFAHDPFAFDRSALDPVVGLDVPPSDPLPAEMREALPALLDDEAAADPAAARRVAGDARTDASSTPAVPNDDDRVVPPPAAPFVTETMAALLASQGHTAQAADVYERLLAQRPDDERLREHLAALRGAADTPDVATQPLEFIDVHADGQPGAADFASGEVADDGDERAARMWRSAFAPLPPVAPDPDPAPERARSVVAAGVPSAAATEPAHGDRDAGLDDLSFDRFFVDAPGPAPAGEFERWAADAARPGSSAFDPTPPSGVGVVVLDLAAPAAVAPAAPLPAAPDDPDEDLAQFNAWLRGLAE